MGPDEHRPLLDHLHAMIFQGLGVETLEPLDLAKHIVAQSRPVEVGFAGFPAEAGSILQVLGEMGAIDEQLLGDAATDHAGSADLMLLGDGYLGAMGRRHTRSANAARTGTDDEKIIIIFQVRSPNARAISASVD